METIFKFKVSNFTFINYFLTEWLYRNGCEIMNGSQNLLPSIIL
jgi:hypothetical protein